MWNLNDTIFEVKELKECDTSVGCRKTFIDGKQHFSDDHNAKEQIHNYDYIRNADKQSPSPRMTNCDMILNENLDR